MEFAKAWSELNWMAVVVAALSTFLVGGIWYTVFDKAWSKANGFTAEFLKTRNMAVVFGVSLVLAFIMALTLALFVGKAGIEFGLVAGLLTGAGWVVPALSIVALFEKRTPAYFLINGGYLMVSFVLMGAIIGLWK